MQTATKPTTTTAHRGRAAHASPDGVARIGQEPKGADVALLRACAEYHRVHAEWHGPFQSDKWSDTLNRRRSEALKRVAEIKPATSEGLLAKASVAYDALMFEVDVFTDKTWRQQAEVEQVLALDVLAGFLGMQAP